jgi:hypothetical protein
MEYIKNNVEQKTFKLECLEILDKKVIISKSENNSKKYLIIKANNHKNQLFLKENLHDEEIKIISKLLCLKN